MARAGRPRKNGPRHPCGQRIRKIVDAQTRLADAEKQVVLAQPHRKGDKSQLAASALGRFIRDHQLRHELLDAAEAWALLRAKWTNSLGAPKLRVIDPVRGSGADIDMKVLNGWRARDLEGRDAMRRAGGEDGLRGVMRLAADDLDLAPHTPVGPIVSALMALAVDMGKLPASALPDAAPRVKTPRIRAKTRVALSL